MKKIRKQVNLLKDERSYVEKRNRAERKLLDRVMSERKILCIAARSNLSSHQLNHIGPVDNHFLLQDCLPSRPSPLLDLVRSMLLFFISREMVEKIECLMDVENCESYRRRTHSNSSDVLNGCAMCAREIESLSLERSGIDRTWPVALRLFAWKSLPDESQDGSSCLALQVVPASSMYCFCAFCPYNFTFLSYSQLFTFLCCSKLWNERHTQATQWAREAHGITWMVIPHDVQRAHTFQAWKKKINRERANTIARERGEKWLSCWRRLKQQKIAKEIKKKQHFSLILNFSDSNSVSFWSLERARASDLSRSGSRRSKLRGGGAEFKDQCKWSESFSVLTNFYWLTLNLSFCETVFLSRVKQIRSRKIFFDFRVVSFECFVFFTARAHPTSNW